MQAALVTGAARGLGRAIALRLHQEGYAVAVNYRQSEASASELVTQIEAGGGRAVALAADVARREEVTDLFDRAYEAFGRLDVVVNNAGISPAREYIADFEIEDFDRLFATNVRGVFLVLKECANRLGDGARIVSISSTTVRFDAPGAGPYAASKAAVERLSAVLAKELAGRNITVNVVAPGLAGTDLAYATNTAEQIQDVIGITPLGRLAEPQEIGDAVAFLVSERAKFIHGAVLAVNGGII
jgi:3-oxoacyl-[acyl-carrier protein] reductase